MRGEVTLEALPDEVSFHRCGRLVQCGAFRRLQGCLCPPHCLLHLLLLLPQALLRQQPLAFSLRARGAGRWANHREESAHVRK